MEAKYSVGQALRIKATGAIITVNQISPGMKEICYIVFEGGKKKRVKESDLEIYIDQESAVLEKIHSGDPRNADELQKFYYYHLYNECQDGNIHSYLGNKIIFNPFQYKPLMKFIANDSDERLLIADEVGVGKTIEAGIILDELVSRGEIETHDVVLIVCPNILTKKWRDELFTKFGYDDFRIHDGKSLEYFLKSLRDNGKTNDTHSIVSEQLFRSEKYTELLSECLDRFDEPFIKLLIVDECHHYRNANTNTNKFGQLISLCSEKVIMLSATPFNLRSSDLYNQLHMLNPALFSDEKVFSHLKQQISLVNSAISFLRTGDYGNLTDAVEKLFEYTDVSSTLAEGLRTLLQKINSGNEITEKDVVDYEDLLNKLNPISSSFTRTLKREAIEHRVTRDVRTLEVELTTKERKIYDKFLESNLLKYQINGVDERAVNLILNGLERIASSSIPALEHNVSKFLDTTDTSFLEEYTEENDINEKTAKKLVDILKYKYSSLIKDIKSLGDIDSKYSAFVELIHKIWEVREAKSQIIVFSFYIGTLKYLRKRLTADGYKVALIYGETPKETVGKKSDEDGYEIISRNEIMERFKKGEYDILLASEVGGEGLDFQFCSALINYDIPYNPMRIEQRIGRIDRMGQKEDRIVIGNLCISNTIDMIINKVLLQRINEASVLVGNLEPIIAKEIEEINSVIIRKSFSDEEILRREKEMINRIEKERLQMEQFDNIRYELVNDSGFRSVFENKINNSRLSPVKSLKYMISFLKTINGCWSKPITETSAKIHISNDIRDKIKARYKKDPSDELKLLICAENDMIVSFSGDEAYESTDMIFMKPSGSFIRFINDYLQNIDKIQYGDYFLCEAPSKDICLKKGQFYVFVFELEFEGFHKTKYIEYVFVDSKTCEVIKDADEFFIDNIFMNMKNCKSSRMIALDSFDDAYINAQEEIEYRQEKYNNEIESINNVKIKSRIEAHKTLAECRIRELQNKLFSVSNMKEEEKIHSSIDRIAKKSEENISRLSKYLSIVSTYSLKAVCVIVST